MKASDLLQASGVFDMISECCRGGIDADWYMFGSAAKGTPLPNDIDILCVAKTSADLPNVWGICETYLLRAPIHLRTLSRENEASLGFIKRCAAVALHKTE